MNVLIILGHPESNSLNHAIAQTCIAQLEAKGHTVSFHDLYAENFDPLLYLNNKNQNEAYNRSNKKHCEDLKRSDGIIIIHPNWWGQPPAIVKGWIDRVLRPGVAYDFFKKDGDWVPVGLLKAKCAIVLNTSNAIYSPGKDPLEMIWKNSVFNFCGIKQVEQRNFSAIKNSDEQQRNTWLHEVRLLVDSYFC